MYADIFGTLPISEALVAKGVWIGNRTFLHDGRDGIVLAVDGHAETGRKTEIVGLFFGIVAVGIIIIGYVFNFLGLIFM